MDYHLISTNMSAFRIFSDFGNFVVVSDGMTLFPEGPGTFRKQRHTIGDDDKITKIRKNPKCTHIGRNEVIIHSFEAHSHFLSITNPAGPQIPPENSKS